jgi:ribonuclease P/MRP protein subunit POP1
MAFPQDWPGTRAGDAEGDRMATQLKQKWKRRQGGKRESWEKVFKGEDRGEAGDPFKCDWQFLFENGQHENMVDDTVREIERIRAQAQAAMDEDATELHKNVGQQFLLSPIYAKQLLTRKSPMMVNSDLSQALLPIRLQFLQKGNVSFRARIYRLPLPSEEREKWTNLLASKAGKSSKEDYPRCPTEQDLLGFVTTGNMSLSEGRGRAVGALSWVKAEAEEDRWIEEKQFRGWCIVRDAGVDIARLARWEVNE